ncbi:hypothetical protein GY21_11110 [Cryobacterium roopkundense]|uniref:Crotonobetainyl-CoA hydratase n=1 Tax=Cryobacterium roopkundense TaxID=1001240 RepID=A0A099J4W8_9MICO|nr:crotonase/enoyl-CoA hydratase family protein [Cryobacterium roopkundense]KGJ73454.1 hypothetical protein GY21_11110 [Cryobacterium roopkundense]MBB5641031.1 crotonobetainyl-CoA hydratase [Cryobacterium roopkundense]
MNAVITERRGSVLIVTLNRPQVLNAVNPEVARELGEALQRLDETPELRVGIITGAGRAFCAGLDMKAVVAGESISATRHPEWGFAGLTSRTVTKPLIAAVNGDAVGGGLEIALACDVILASNMARFGLPEVSRGLLAAGGGVYRLAQQLPEKVAMELLLTGRLADASEMHGRGLVHAVVAPGDVLPAALAMAERIASNAPLAVQATKRLARSARVLEPTHANAVALADEEAATIFETVDAREGIAAFVEGRPPVFWGS